MNADSGLGKDDSRERQFEKSNLRRKNALIEEIRTRSAEFETSELYDDMLMKLRVHLEVGKLNPN